MRCALWVPEDKEKRTQAEGAPDQAPVKIVSARLRAPCDAQCAAPPVFHPCGSEAWPVRAAVPAATHISHEAVVQSPSASDGANPPLVFSNDGIVAPAFVQTVDSPRWGNGGTSSLFPRNCQKAPHKRPRNTFGGCATLSAFESCFESCGPRLGGTPPLPSSVSLNTEAMN
jgi:hypothetical protein